MGTKSFIDITDDEWKALVHACTTWGDIDDAYAQPSWCDYQGGLDGVMGCWSLVGRLVKDESYCHGCECHIAEKMAA